MLPIPNVFISAPLAGRVVGLKTEQASTMGFLVIVSNRFSMWLIIASRSVVLSLAHRVACFCVSCTSRNEQVLSSYFALNFLTKPSFLGPSRSFAGLLHVDLITNGKSLTNRSSLWKDSDSPVSVAKKRSARMCSRRTNRRLVTVFI